MKDYSKLKSGSDVRGVALEGVLNEHVNLTDETVSDIAKAFVYYLNKKYNKSSFKIAVGHDSRLSHERIEAVTVNALKESGADVYRCHLSTTPAMFMTTKLCDFDAAIEITASHLPYNKNGLKFFVSSGGLEGFEIKEILNYAEQGLSISKKGSVNELDFMSMYSSHLVKMVREKTHEDKPLKGLKIIVDAGNGAGGFYQKSVLEVLGADTTGSQFLEPDGRFPNHIPNPENPEAIKSISDKVKEVKADFGIIFDTDVDRAGAVDDTGKEINRNRLIALISSILLEEKKNGIIVTDSLTSDGLREFIEKRGGIHHRFKRGYENVIDESIRLNNEGKYSPLAIETSGHAALKENYFLDDGAYLITRILIKISELNKKGQKLSNLLDDLKEPLESVEIRMSFDKSIDFIEYGNNILLNLVEYAKKMSYNLTPNNYEGVRIDFDKENGDGWLLLRMSLHDPIMPLNIESNSPNGSKIIAKKLLEYLNNYDLLDKTNLINYIK